MGYFFIMSTLPYFINNELAIFIGKMNGINRQSERHLYTVQGWTLVGCALYHCDGTIGHDKAIYCN